MIIPVSIIIPTCKDTGAVSNVVKEVKDTMQGPGQVIATCYKGSASQNRNIGLNAAKCELVIMIDDDMTGFYPGWNTDLVEPMLSDRNILMISARLLKPNGTPNYTMGENYNLTSPLALSKIVPTACVAFWNTPLRFDEAFIGSGFEDNDFCYQLQQQQPNGVFATNNKCRLIHINEKKNQGGRYWEINKRTFENKWGHRK